jgi:hypothetical protein
VTCACIIPSSSAGEASAMYNTPGKSAVIVFDHAMTIFIVVSLYVKRIRLGKSREKLVCFSCGTCRGSPKDRGGLCAHEYAAKTVTKQASSQRVSIIAGSSTTRNDTPGRVIDDTSDSDDEGGDHEDEGDEEEYIDSEIYSHIRESSRTQYTSRWPRTLFACASDEGRLRSIVAPILAACSNAAVSGNVLPGFFDGINRTARQNTSLSCL